MKQLFTNYSISGSTITLTGLNVPLNQLLCIEDNTNGKELYATGTVAPTSYTQGTNSVIVTSVAPSSNSDKLTIYYDDAIVSNINTSTLALESGGHLASVDSKLTTGVPVTGTFYQATQPVSLASLPSLATGANTIGSISNTAFTANAGTNLNTSLLALESGGNLATIATNTGKIPSKGAATTANSTPVNIASDQIVPVSGTVTANTGLSQPLTDAQLRATAVPVSGTFYQATQPVSGSVTATISGTPTVTVGNTSIPVTGTFYQATQPVSGTVTANVQGGNSTAVKVDGSAVTQPVSGTVSVSGTVPVSGTFYQDTQPVSVASLPSLASGTNAIGTVNPDISPATGSLSSGSNTYTVTTTNYSTLTFQAVKSGTISSGTVTIYGSVDGTTFSVLTTYVALTTGGSSTTFSATNAITAGQINTSGLKAVQFSGGSTIVGGGSLAFTVNQSATVSNVMLDNALPVGSNTIGNVGLNAGSNVIGQVTANAGTNLNTSALALESGGNLATCATKMSDGSQTTKIVNGANTLSVDSAGAVTANNAASQVFNYTATGAVAINTVLLSIDATLFREISLQIVSAGTGFSVTGQVSNDGTNWSTCPAVVTNGVVSQAQYSGTNLIYNYTAYNARYFRFQQSAAQTAGTTTLVAYASQQATPKLYQSVVVTGQSAVIPQPSVANGFTTYHTLISAASTNATSVKASAGMIGTCVLTNTSTTFKYFKVFNSSAAPTTGTSTPVIQFPVAPNSTLDVSMSFAGLRLGTGIAYAITGGSALLDNTAVGAGEVLVNLSYV
jgi:hypothetical protein